MNKRYVAISLTLGSLALAGGAQADTWDVTQKVTVGADTTVTQGKKNTSATQAMNAIDVGTLTGTSQAVQMETYTLTLTQEGASTASSNQAANYVQADTISGAFSQDVNSEAPASAITLTQSASGTYNIQALNMADGGTVGSTEIFSQDVTPTGGEGDITLTQTTGMGANSVQAANYIKGTTITRAIQTVDNDTAGDGDITLLQPTGNKITQAVNYAKAGTITSLEQNIKTVDLVLDQHSGTSNVQVGNYAQATTGVDTLLSQKTDAFGMIDMDQDTTGGDGNLQAVNAADVASVTGTGTVTQAATTGDPDINLKQEAQNSSEQAVNYLTSKGTVASVTQNYVNSDKTATLSQDGTVSSAQALNFIDMTDGADVLTKGTQTVTLATLSLSQGHTTINTGSSQAANLLLSENEIAEASQTVTADIDVTQEKGTGNLQAVNLAAGIDITSLTQTINGASDTFEQGSTDAATNTQAGNYLAAAGTVGSVVQNYSYSATASVLMEQDDITSGVQGLNVIDASASSGVTVTKADQNVTVPSLTMHQGRDVGTTTSVQAGNAVITDALATGNAVDQDVSVTTLVMTQANSSRSVQAANFVGNRPL